MEKEMTNKTDAVEKKAYVAPELKRAERLTDITEGAAPVVSGAVAT